MPAQLRLPAFQFMIPLSISPAHDVVSHVLRHIAITWTPQGSEGAAALGRSGQRHHAPRWAHGQ